MISGIRFIRVSHLLSIRCIYLICHEVIYMSFENLLNCGAELNTTQS
jgi:hypothetical protein